MIELRALAGSAAQPHLADVARLRIEIFRDYPYLYDGDPAYEQDYLAAYARSPQSVFVLAFDADVVVGASTGLPLAQDGEAYQRPFRARGMDVDQVFYFGESVLRPAYRGQGIGHRFFDAREAHVRALGAYSHCAFAAIDRDADDPRRPPGHRDNDAFWHKRGYVRQPGLTMRLAWKEVGASEASEHPLTFWLRPSAEA